VNTTVSTMTVTIAGHGYSTGNVILISGANQSDYNGQWTITVTGVNTFIYVLLNLITPTTPATGTITAKLVIRADVRVYGRPLTP
jgi:hypothetical protein